MTDPDLELIRARQRGRARVTAFALIALVVLIYLIGLVRMGVFR